MQRRKEISVGKGNNILCSRTKHNTPRKNKIRLKHITFKANHEQIQKQYTIEHDMSTMRETEGVNKKIKKTYPNEAKRAPAQHADYGNLPSCMNL